MAAMHEYLSAEGYVAMLRQDVQTLRDEGTAYETASKDGVAVMVLSSEEQVAAIRCEANAYRNNIDAQRMSLQATEHSEQTVSEFRSGSSRSPRWLSKETETAGARLSN